MEKYRRVEKPKEKEEVKEKNFIRVTTQGKMRNYIAYAANLLQSGQFNSVTINSMGRAINKAVTIAEIIKRRVPGLHQNTSIGSLDITDTYEPIEVGLDNVEFTRHVSTITIVLSTAPLDPNAPGYQPPLPLDQVKPLPPPSEGEKEKKTDGKAEGAERGERGRGRGGRRRGSGQRKSRGRAKAAGGLVAAPADPGVGRGRGTGRRGLGGRGRAVRGHGRGRGRGAPAPQPPQPQPAPPSAAST